MTTDPLLRPGDVAKAMGVTLKTVRRWANTGLIRCVRTPGGHRRYPLSEVQRLIREGLNEDHTSGR